VESGSQSQVASDGIDLLYAAIQSASYMRLTNSYHQQAKQLHSINEPQAVMSHTREGSNVTHPGGR
jgi:hypothetical protein